MVEKRKKKKLSKSKKLLKKEKISQSMYLVVKVFLVRVLNYICPIPKTVVSL